VTFSLFKELLIQRLYSLNKSDLSTLATLFINNYLNLLLTSVCYQGMVLGHDGQLKSLLEVAKGRPIPGPGPNSYLDEILDVKLTGIRAEILDDFERRLTGMETHCDERIGEMQKQCHREHMDGQEQMQQSLDGRETGLREELGSLQAQIQGLTLTESCCGQV